jgi:glucose/arabinose dehydrogenase
MEDELMKPRLSVAGLLAVAAVVAGGPAALNEANAAEPRTIDGAFVATDVAKFSQPWAMTFLPDGRLLVTEKRGALKLHTLGGGTGTVTGVPAVASGGQGGFADVILHPAFATNGLVYLSYAEPGEGSKRGAAVARARLMLDSAGGGALSNLTVIWRQEPKVEGEGHYGHRLAFGPDGKLWISSSERQKFDPAQDMKTNLGKMIRLNEDGSVPSDNPFASQGGVAAQAWSLGHRNVLGVAFDEQGRLWTHEMGPKGGDELNLIERGANYGYPLVSNGDHYDGKPIPDHPTRPDLNAPEVTWNPVISPAGFIIYTGSQFPKWKGNGFIGGLSSQALVRVEFDGTTAKEAQRFSMGARIREVEQGPDGAIWVLEDERSGTGGRLLKLTPVKS